MGKLLRVNQKLEKKTAGIATHEGPAQTRANPIRRKEHSHARNREAHAPCLGTPLAFRRCTISAAASRDFEFMACLALVRARHAATPVGHFTASSRRAGPLSLGKLDPIGRDGAEQFRGQWAYGHRVT
jgi:hypothetical protein